MHLDLLISKLKHDFTATYFTKGMGHRKDDPCGKLSGLPWNLLWGSAEALRCSCGLTRRNYVLCTSDSYLLSSGFSDSLAWFSNLTCGPFQQILWHKICCLGDFRPNLRAFGLLLHCCRLFPPLSVLPCGAFRQKSMAQNQWKGI